VSQTYNNQNKIHLKYSFHNKLGEGSYAKVYSDGIDDLIKEINIMKSQTICESIVPLHSVYDTLDHIHLVMDYHLVGDLLQKVIRRG
jgi:serine/threonine protein kinase